MAKIILKWRYLKPGAKAHNENLVKYIAKREGVDKIDDSWKAEPVSKAQQNMIDELLQEFPESKDSYEYQDLLRQPNKGNASEFITRTIEENLDQVDKRENYVQYIAKRPRVEKIGTHGLFTDDNVPVHLNEVAEEVATHQGVLMTQILSLRREDAARLGYEKGEAWRTLIRNHTKDMAEAMNIPMEDLRWYAAFHNESHHPHCHIIAYSIGKEPYITQERLLKLKSAFGSEMFRNERMQAFQEQTEYRDQLAEETRQLVSRIVDEINTGVYQNETVALMLQSLSEYVQRAKGKKQYGYLPQSARNLVNGIIDELAKDPRIESLYELWYKQSVEIASIYQDNPPVKPPLSENKSFHKVRNIVVQEATIAILFSKVKVQSGDQSETFLIDGIPKEYEDLSASRQLEWFLQDIDSDATVQVHADAYLYGEGEVVRANHAELCYFLDRMRLNPNFLESRCQSAGSSDFNFDWSPQELFG